MASAFGDNTTWLYMDEAGNFDFSGSYSRFLVLTCVAMLRPFAHVPSLMSLKYDCLDYGVRQ